MELLRDNGFFQTISKLYGTNITLLMKSWITLRKKICTSQQQLTFLLRCRRCDVTPSHIRNIKINIYFQSNSVNRKFEKTTKNMQENLLNLEIKDSNFHLNYMRNKIKKIEDRLFEKLPHDLVTRFFTLNRHVISACNREQKLISIRKFNNLLFRQNKSVNPFINIDKSKWLLNISNKIIPNRVADLLSLGDGFGLPLHQSCKSDRERVALGIIKNFEVNAHRIPTKLLETTRISVAGSLQRFLSVHRHINSADRYILDAFSLCKKFLRDNADIIVTRADKGQVTVVMDKKEYVDKMRTLLNDRSTYKELDKDPIKQLTRNINSLVKSWQKNDLIDDATYRFLNCTNGNLPRCYGLPKVHKTGFPLRLIVSSLGSPIYNVASFIHDILHRSIKKPESHIKDGWSFATTIAGRGIGDDEVMISLDVSSLFTNIPKQLVINAIEKRWNDIAHNTTFSLPQFLHAITTVLDSTSFCFEGRFYEQIYGSPMGSPLSPILANMVIQDLETLCLSLLGFSVPLYYRYVDDIFAVVPRTKIDEILLTFNSYHPRLHFTYELEFDSAINFLNTTVIRCDGKLITNWFRKTTCSDRYINYHSNHPMNYKMNTIYNLVDHAILLSDDRFHLTNIEIVENILHKNCFPTHIIRRHIKKRLNILKQRKINNVDVNKDNATVNRFDLSSVVTLPYVVGLSDDIQREFNRIGLNVVYNIPKKMDLLIKRNKDRIPTNDRTEVVYKIDCSNCDASYIGQTKRHLSTRVKEHFNNIKMHTSNFSVISKHKLDCGHDFKWSAPQVLHKEKNVRKREIAEMFFIKKFDNTLNLHKDTENLNSNYDKIIKVA